jgi:AcrR family transcriptional regulator
LEQPLFHVQSGTTRAKLLYSAVLLFLERGYQNTTAQMISEKIGMTTGAFFRAFPNKESLLYTLTEYMLDILFDRAANELGPETDPLLVYSVSISVQFHIAELSASLQDVYVTAYSLPSTSECIYQKVTKKTARFFQQYLPDFEEKDFYETEIATGGMVRSYLARKCDLYFTVEQKLRRFLSASLTVYNVPRETRERIIGQTLAQDLHGMAQQLLEDTVAQAERGFDRELRS